MVPMGIVRKMYGKGAVAEQAYRIASNSVFEYLQKEGIDYVGDVIPSDEQGDFDFENNTEHEFMFEIGEAPKVEVELSAKDKLTYSTIKVDKKMLSAYKDNYKLIVEKGHTLGNHTLTHEWDSVYSTIEGFVDEVQQLQDKIYELTGYKMTLFRFPGGTNNTINQKYNSESSFCTEAVKRITAMDLVYFDWNIDSGDASSNWKDLTADDIAKRVLSQAKNKTTAVILMHDVSTKKATREALPAIIEGLLEMGFEIEALSSTSEAIRFTPATRKS